MVAGLHRTGAAQLGAGDLMRIEGTTKRVMVTGGAGFLGSHLCEKLLAQGHDMLCVDNFIVQALKGEDITLYGDDRQTRSFCYVDDLIDGLVCLMDSTDDFTGPANIGNPGEFTILQLAEHAIELTGSKSKLGWAPSTPLDEGLKKTIAYFDQLLR
jgi:nucleoside-diphosphate-sugar epimerase